MALAMDERYEKKVFPEGTSWPKTGSYIKEGCNAPARGAPMSEKAQKPTRRWIMAAKGRVRETLTGSSAE